MKKAWPYIITIAIIILGLIIIFSPSKTSGVPTKTTLFVGQGCPHCKNVEDFIASNGVDKKYDFDTKEVWYGNSCYSGEIEIINFFKTKL